MPLADRGDRDLTSGAVLRKRYVLQELIGCGGHSLVFRAKDLHRVSPEDPDHNCVALKVLQPALRGNERAIARLAREFRQMQRLAHAGIARVFDLDCDGDIWFMTMELVHGQTLGEWTRKSPDVADAMHVIGACAQALGYAHSRGIVHGDLKPSNILVTSDLAVRLIDFGSVVTGSRDVAATTPLYASPQVLAGMPADVRDDVFSLACLSYGLLADGERPFGDQSSLDAHRARLCPAAIAGMPVEVFSVLTRNLAGDREQRCASAEEFYQELLAPTREASRNRRRAHGERHASHHRVLRQVSLASMGVAAACALTLLLPAARKIVAGTDADAVVQNSTQGAPSTRVGSNLASGAVSIASGAAAVPARPGTPAAAEVASTADAIGPAAGNPAPTLRMAAGSVSFESATLVAGAGQSMIAIPLRRSESTHGSAAVQWEIEGGNAMPNVDYEPVSPRVVRFNDGEAVRSLFIPLLRSGDVAKTRSLRTFTVALRRVGGGARLGAMTRVHVTILPQSGFPDVRNAVAASSLPGL